jgi:hypothetical protein
MHLERSDSGKDVPVGQLGICFGIWIDSHKGRLKLTDAKWKKLLADFRLVMSHDLGGSDAPDGVQVQGKAHQLFGVHHHDSAVCLALQRVYRWFRVAHGTSRRLGHCIDSCAEHATDRRGS